MKLTFLGAAQNVTGSAYLLEAAGRRLLIDCGLYQERALKPRNWEPFPVPPASIDAVLLTHAHLDHCGRLPTLVRQGFAGPIYCTPATADVARIVLLDSAKVQTEDAAFKRKRHQREGRRGPYPEQPLYTAEEAEAVCSRFSPAAYETPLALGDGLAAAFHDAGHILGSASVSVRAGINGAERAVVFSGDVGRWNAPILRDPVPPAAADYVLVESTYGDREHHPEASIPEKLAQVVNDAVQRGGKILIPSFAVERSQDLLFHLSALLSARRIPPLKVFLDSPMAISVTEVFRRHPELFDAETAALIRAGKHPCDFPGLIACRTADESKAIRDQPGACIVIAGSGMCTAGRIKHHLANHIGDPRCTVLFVGYQAADTLGRIILEGAARVRILGAEYAVKARVVKINGFSAHADREELWRWLGALSRPPRRAFVIHGEPPTSAAFAAFLRGKSGWPVAVANYRDEVELD